MNGSARVSTEFRKGAEWRVARNALDERLDDVEYASKLLDGQDGHVEHAEVYSRGRRRERTLSSVVLVTGLISLSERVGGRG